MLEYDGSEEDEYDIKFKLGGNIIFYSLLMLAARFVDCEDFPKLLIQYGANCY